MFRSSSKKDYSIVKRNVLDTTSKTLTHDFYEYTKTEKAKNCNFFTRPHMTKKKTTSDQT
jgi:hypothetical protein